MKVKNLLLLAFIMVAVSGNLLFSKEFHTINVHLTEVKAPYEIEIKGSYKAYNYKYESEIISSSKDDNTIKITEHTLGLKVNTGVGTYEEGIVFDTTEGFILNGIEYFGGLMFIPYEGGFIVINRLDVEDYVKGVLPYEMSPSWPIEALKAQAVAARTYAIFHILKNNGEKPFDVDNTTKFQVYNGKSQINLQIEEAVARTKYEIATYEGKVIASYFSSICAGHTDSSKNVFGQSVPYLQGVSCQYCNSQIKPWTNAVSYKDLNNALAPLKIKVDSKTDFTVEKNPISTKVESINIKTKNTDNNISSRDFRAYLTISLIPSLDFSINKVDNGIVAIGKGIGHGVGMCQWGAFGMAQVNKKYKDILKFYYKGVNIVDHTKIKKDLVADIW